MTYRNLYSKNDTGELYLGAIRFHSQEKAEVIGLMDQSRSTLVRVVEEPFIPAEGEVVAHIDDVTMEIGENGDWVLRN